MPRTKQQRPMHIMEHKSTEDVKCNEDMPSASPYEFSSSESTLSSQESNLKAEEEVLCIEASSPNARSSTPMKSDGMCSNETAGTPAGSESDSRSRSEENDREDNGSVQPNERNLEGRFSPFVNLPNFPWKGMNYPPPPETGENGHTGQNPFHYPDFSTSPNIRGGSVLGMANGFKNLPLPGEVLKNGAMSGGRNPQLAAILQNILPFHLMAKFLYDSNKNGIGNFMDKNSNESRILKTPTATEPTTLDAIKHHVLDKKMRTSDGLQETRRSKTSTPDSTISLPAETVRGQNKDDLSTPEDPLASSDSKILRPFLSIQEMISGKKDDSVVSQDKNVKMEMPQFKTVSPQFPSLAFQAAPTTLLPSRENESLKKKIRKYSEENLSVPQAKDKLKSKSPDRNPTASPSVEAHHKFLERNSVPVGYPSYPNSCLQYPGKIRPNGSKRRREKYLGPYGFSRIPVSPHGCFPAVIPSFPDFPAMAPPYYSPWGMIHPMHPGIDGIQANPVFQTLQPTVPMWPPKPSSCKRGSLSGHISPCPTSSMSYQSSSTSPRNSGSPRAKVKSSNPINSLHDAIVEEAKKMNKGMDPENMYIECPICHKKIKRLYHFQRHMRIHSGEKSHTCPFCPYKSVRKDNLKSHMKTHEKTKYDGSRRVQQQRRDSSGRSPFPQRPEFRLPMDKEDGSSPSNPANGAGFLSLPSKQGNIPAISPPVHQRAGSNEELIDFSANTIVNDMALLPPAPYIPKSGFPYAGYPVIPPFPQLLGRRKPQISSARITEIDDRTSSHVSDSKTEEKKRIEQFKNRHASAYKQHRSETPNRGSPKRYKISPTNVEETLLLGNSNNSNNLDRKPLQIYSPASDNNFNVNDNPTYSLHARDSHETKKERPSDGFFENVSEIRSEDKIDNKEYRAESKVDSPRSDVDMKMAEQQNGDFHTEFSHQSATLGIPSFAPGKTELGSPENDAFDEEPRNSNENKRDDIVPTKASPGFLSSSPSASLMVSSPNHKFQRADEPLFGEDESERSFETETKPIYIKSEATCSGDSTPRCNISSTWMTTQKESKCRLCDFSAPNNSSLQEHMTSHKEDGMYKCQQCDYHGKNLSKLIEHIRIHTGERPFQCDQCSYAAKRKDNLAQHKSVRHDKNRFKGPARILKLPSQREYDSPRKSPTSRDIPQRNSEYRSIEVGSALSQPKLKMENAPSLACAEWISKFGDGRLPASLAEEKFTAIEREKGLATSKGSPALFNPLAYPFLSYNKMTSSILCGHPLLTPSVFPHLAALPPEENGVSGMDIPPTFSSSTKSTGRMNSKPSFAKSLQECAR